MKLYIDMDGVLCDFESAAKRVHGISETETLAAFIDKFGKDAFWEPIHDTPGFWENLEPLVADGGTRDVWHRLERLCPHIAILSAPSRRSGDCIAGKIRWLDKHVGPGLRLFTKDKAKYACPASVLVDDLPANVAAWRKAGGKAILFTGFTDEFWKELSETLTAIKVNKCMAKES